MSSYLRDLSLSELRDEEDLLLPELLLLVAGALCLEDDFGAEAVC
jgi:hypothetical protein